MRLFLAIDFPKEIKHSLYNEITFLKKKFPDLKWIKKPSLHLTLKFLGETETTLQRKIESTLNTAFQSTDNFDLITTEPGFFPNQKKARVYYLGLQQSETLQKCYHIIEDKLFELGIEKEKRTFNPHITLARIKNISLDSDEQHFLQEYKIPQKQISVPEITLMKSEFTSSGVRYTPVQRFSLRCT
jgi:2'-5' RNA ligase